MAKTDDDAHPVAQAVHDLGNALWFGGAVMGVAGVNKSGADLQQGIDRVRVASSAWSRFGPVEWAGIAATVVADARLASTSKQRLVAQEGFAVLVTAKTAVTWAGIAATAYATYTGRKVGQAAEAAVAAKGSVEVQDASIPTGATPPDLARWQRRQRTSQYLVPLFAGASIVLASSITQATRPAATARGVLGRLLPG